MNCKQGDLAIIVGSFVTNSPNIGKIVRCIRWVGEPDCLKSSLKDYWEVNQELEFYRADGSVALKEHLSSDSRMIPLNHNINEELEKEKEYELPEETA